ncbi:MAG TPA: alkaline phosphatase family protein [Chitinophagaceae bacterium]|nr:alkaline phosphatase family protein [Chitinophagaceae bacterium]
MRKFILSIVASLFWLLAISQSMKTENIIVITLDGFRWEELFGGADSALIRNVNFSRDTSALQQAFWSASADERRKKLMPFFWSTIQSQGQLYGNRWTGSQVNNANKYWFSYPGYNEIFTGYPDDSVNSNDKIWNKNINVLEYINQQPAYKNKVAVFSTWDVFPYILNTKRSGLYVNADVDSLHFNSKEFQLINDIQFLTTRPLGVRPDVLTYIAGREYLKAYQPKVLYIAFDETDDFAHAGMYDQYLASAHAEDAMIADLWKTVQSMPAYRNKTTMLITCDHGRGDKIKDQWKDHGTKIADAGQIWVAALGPDTSPLGEVKNGPVLYQRQLATTIAALIGMVFKPAHPTMEPISSILH